MKFKYEENIKYNHPFYGKGVGQVVAFCKTSYDVKAPHYSYLIKSYDGGRPTFWDEEEKLTKLSKKGKKQ